MYLLILKYRMHQRLQLMRLSKLVEVSQFSIGLILSWGVTWNLISLMNVKSLRRQCHLTSKLRSLKSWKARVSKFLTHQLLGLLTTLSRLWLRELKRNVECVRVLTMRCFQSTQLPEFLTWVKTSPESKEIYCQWNSSCLSDTLSACQ